MAFFQRLDDATFLPTPATGGAWNTNEQHIAPAIGLIAHVLELDSAKRGHGFEVARLSYDILGPIPIEPVQMQVAVVRPGRTIELVECTLLHNQRPAVRLRAWLMQSRDSGRVAGTPFPMIASAEMMSPWDPSTIWPGEFIKNVEIRRELQQPGRARYWARSRQPLLEGEPVSELARAAALFDIANGMAVRALPQEVAFPNLDLTVHLFDRPQGEWLGFDTSVSFGPHGIGLTSSVVHDERGPIGTIGQALTVRLEHAVPLGLECFGQPCRATTISTGRCSVDCAAP